MWGHRHSGALVRHIRENEGVGVARDSLDVDGGQNEDGYDDDGSNLNRDDLDSVGSPSPAVIKVVSTLVTLL